MIHTVDVSSFTPRISLPGKPHDTADLPQEKIWIDSAFIGSCTNGRMEDLRAAADDSGGKKCGRRSCSENSTCHRPGVVKCLEEGLLEIFKESGALVSNAGCAGCAAGQVGQNGPGEVTVSTGNRNFPGKQGQGDVYLASPAVVAASAVAGYITGPETIPEHPQKRITEPKEKSIVRPKKSQVQSEHPVEIKGRVWFIPRDNIDTDMIFHNRYLSITDVAEMGQYTFDNLEGYEDFATRVKAGGYCGDWKEFRIRKLQTTGRRLLCFSGCPMCDGRILWSHL